MSELFLDTLDKNRLTVFKKLVNFKDIGVLGGGTAIALQINHRRSFDFDIFLNEPIKENLLTKAHKIFGPGCVQTLNITDQINLVTPENVSVTFFYDSAPSLFPVIKTKPIDLMNLRDLASNKAVTIGFRGKWRDYVDVYFLLREKKTSLKEIISVSQKRRGLEFSTRLFLQQLTYFDDLTDYTIDFIGSPVSPEEIKNFISQQAKNDFRD